MNEHQRDTLQKQQAEQARLANVAKDMISGLFGSAPPGAHSVVVHSSVGDDGEFVNAIHVSVRPGCEHMLSVPDEHQGEPITLVPWSD